MSVTVHCGESTEKNGHFFVSVSGQKKKKKKEFKVGRNLFHNVWRIVRSKRSNK
jgi:hypothetical protein